MRSSSPRIVGRARRAVTAPWSELACYDPSMPLYEYVCKECRHPFEALVLGDEKPQCPACMGTSLEKQFSLFATSNNDAATYQPPGPCGTCGDPRGQGSCATG